MNDAGSLIWLAIIIVVTVWIAYSVSTYNDHE